MAITAAELLVRVSADTDNAERGLTNINRLVGGLASPFSMAHGAMRGFTNALKGMAVVAGGMLAARMFERLANGIRGIISGSIGAAAEMQNMRLAFETLAAREISRGREVTVQRKVLLHLTAKEREQLETLNLQRKLLSARLQEEAERHRQLVARYGDEGLAVKRHAAQMEMLRHRYEKISAEADQLASKEGKLVTVTEKRRVGQMALSEAWGKAKEKAAEMLNEIRRIAIISPYEYQAVASTYRLQMAFGASSDMAKELTEAILDTSAGLGLSRDEMNRLAYNFGQIRMVGKIMGVDLRQLRMVGLDLADVFRQELGMSVKEVNAALQSGKLTMDDVSRAFVKYAKDNFWGAAQRMSRTWNGLKSSFHDFFHFAAVDLLTPALDRVSAALGDVFDKLSGALASGYFKRLGQRLGDATGKALRFASSVARVALRLFEAYKGSGLKGFVNVLRAEFPDAAVKADSVLRRLHPVFDLLSKAANVARGWIRRLVDMFRSVPSVVRSLAGQVGGAVSRIADTLRGWWQGHGESIRRFFRSMFDAAKEGLAHVRDLWKKHGGQVISTVEGYLGSLREAFSAKLQEVMDTVGNVLNTLRGWWQGHGESVTQSLTSMFGAARGMLGGMSDLWAQHGGMVTNVVGGYLGAVREIFGAELQGIVHAVGDVLGILRDWWQEHGESVRIIVTRFLEAIAAVIGGFMLLVTTVWRNYGEDIKEIVSAMWDVVKTIFQDALNILGDVMDALAALLSGDWEGLKNSLWQLTKDMWALIRDAVEKGGGLVVTLVKKIVGNVKKKFEEVDWHKVGKEILQGVKNGIADMVDALLKKVKEVVGSVKGKFTHVDWHKLGEDIIDGIKGGVEAAIGRLVGAAVAAVQRVWDAVTHAADAHSPSRRFMKIGQWMMEGWAIGLERNTRLAVEAARNSTRAVMGAVMGTSLSMPVRMQPTFASPSPVSPSYGSGGRVMVVFNYQPVVSTIQSEEDAAIALEPVVRRVLRMVQERIV